MTLRARLGESVAGVLLPRRGAAGPLGWLCHRWEVHWARRAPVGPTVLERVLAAFAADHPAAVVVEVGAHDGIQRDPLRRYILTLDWTTYLLEPQPPVYALLRRNVRRLPGTRPRNVAIADVDGALPFYVVAPPAPGEEIWPWYDALASFDRAVVAKHTNYIPDIEDRIVATEVPTMTGATFLAREAITRLDLLQVDTEGHDLEVLRQFDLGRLRPAVVVWEHSHLDEADRDAARALLEGNGYELTTHIIDTIAVRGDYLGDRSTAMHAAWRSSAAEASPG